MQKFSKPLLITIAIILQSIPAFATTETFQLSVTIPEHIIVNSTTAPKQFSTNINQLIQTQLVTRNNQPINLVSIVVP